jgi:hypothetical protein
VLVCFTSFLVFFVVAIAVCFRAWLLVDASIGMVAVVFMVLVVVVTVGREVVLSLLLVGQELVDEAFCLGAMRCWRAAEMGWDRVVGNEGALATVGVGRVEDDLLELAAHPGQENTRLFTSTESRSSSLAERPSSSEMGFGELELAIVDVSLRDNG